MFGGLAGTAEGTRVPSKQHMGLAMSPVLGVVGSVVGGLVANALGTGDMSS
jgi:uncharacterized membrane protein YeaQ/YmgE (transglycosylase-associated protein family)